MKFAALSLLSFFSAAFLTSPCEGQNQPFQHIIIVLQENRTPDNLFQDLCSTLGVQPCPYNISSEGITPSGHPIALTPDPLTDDLDPDHSRIPTFSMEYNGGGINQGPEWVFCTMSPFCCTLFGHKNKPSCMENNVEVYNWLHFVNNDLFTYNGNQYYRLNPYLQIAIQYGWGNYMFQTNQGPSFPAHQFVFGGTSAPGEPPNATFLAENPGDNTFDDDTGCAGSTSNNAKVYIIDSSGNENTSIIPCVDHPTLSDRIEGASLGWRYYANNEDGIWTAPNAIQHICDPISNPSLCAGMDFRNHVVVGNTGPGQILTDLAADGSQNCNNLQPVSWVIPDGTWSDHGGPSLGYGPAWLSALVNAVGGYYFDSSGHQHSTGCNFWTNTAIFITWDDWGGWYDHIVPPIVPLNSRQFGSGYLYGFRVPLIVVSAYTPAATVSGPVVSNFNASSFCAPTQQTSIYCHDFGSILAFTENNFKLQTIDNSKGGGYADLHAMDAQYPGNFPLQEFFTLTTARQFQIIPGPVPASCFITPTYSCFAGYTGPVDPDNDANETP
ncbi:MAG TPA: alkaline phosphatase family protein [Terriglobales bacterium]|nr:alkaline phosphatase family protein [Terriglobales bacterium]